MVENADQSAAPVWDYSATKTEEAAPKDGADDQAGAAGADEAKDGASDEAPEKKADPAGDEGKPADKAADEPKDDKKEAKPKAPATRDVSEFVKARQAKRAAKAAAKAHEEEGYDDQDQDEGDDEDVAPEDQEMVDKAFKKKYGKHIEHIERQAALAEIDTFTKASKYADQYTPEVRESFIAHAMDPAYQRVAFENIEAIVLGPQFFIELGAKREKEAAAKAAATKTGGGTAGGADEKKPVDWSKMTPEEFEKAKMAVLNRS